MDFSFGLAEPMEQYAQGEKIYWAKNCSECGKVSLISN